jgi:hypothetical protein
MAWSMFFDYDGKHDVVTATFKDVVLQNADDVERWRKDVEERLGRFNGKVDLLIDLTGLVVKFTAGRVFGQARTEVLARYTRRSFRYGGDETTRMFVNTSGMIMGAATNTYPTREEALAALLAARSKESPAR